MKKHLATGCIAAVALAWSFGMTGCCCQRKGLVLRGDWSLEMNRVPHMRSNGPTYSGDCDATCDETSCTSESCTDGGCLSCREGGQMGGRSGGSRGARGEYYEQGPGGAGGYDAGPHAPTPPQPTPPQPTPAAQSRFHPVPTRPVFEPQHSVANVPVEVGAGGGINNTGSRRAVEQRRAPARPSEPNAAPRGNNRVAAIGASVEREPRNFEPEVLQTSVEEEVVDEVASTDRVAEEATADREPSTSAWRVKTRRS